MSCTIEEELAATYSGVRSAAIIVADDPIKPLLEEAKRLYSKILCGEKGMIRRRDAIIIRAWHFGRLLCDMKERIGHGKWLFWLGGNFSELSEKTAQRAMQLFTANEEANPSNLTDLDANSVRAFAGGYVPEKERVLIPGDAQVARVVTHLTFVNQLSKFQQRVKEGLDVAPDLPTLKHDLEPAVRAIAELAGREWILEVLA